VKRKRGTVDEREKESEKVEGGVIKEKQKRSVNRRERERERPELVAVKKVILFCSWFMILVVVRVPEPQQHSFI
jgi:hypothetical protein